MTIFLELADQPADQIIAGEITGISPDSLAEALDLRPGDRLLAVNGHPVEDIIDVQYYGADEELELLIERDGERILFEAEREYGQELGIEFAHPTFDTDIRRCNNLCEFCFVLQMGPKFRRTLYIKDDDYRYSFLFGHFVTLTNLSEHDWWRIETMGLSPLYISVHVTDLEQRRRFLRNENAPDILDQLRWLAGRGIEMHTQLVLVPDFNDGPWMDRSIAELAELWPAVRSISVVPVGLTAHHKYKMRTHTAAEAAAILDQLEKRQAYFQQEFGVRFVYPTDEWYLIAGRDVPPIDAYDDQALHENGLGMVRHFLDEWHGVKEEIVAWQAGRSRLLRRDLRLSLATGRLFAETLSAAAAEFSDLTGIPVAVHAMTNRRLGEGITAAGLLMAEDVLQQMAALDLGDIVVLPRIMFDHPQTVSLDDLSPQAVADRLGHPLALADTMGDVWDVVIGESRTLFKPANPGSPE